MMLYFSYKCNDKDININFGLPCAGATTGGRTITATDEVVCDTKMWFAKFALTTAVACKQRNNTNDLYISTE